MIKIDFKNFTYECPFCKRQQAFSQNNADDTFVGYRIRYTNREEYENRDMRIYHIKCTNKNCGKLTVIAKSEHGIKQWDLIPENVYTEYPEYIPEQIRNDYKEACMIIDKSPKAAATLLRRCLQGMIHDFWGIIEKDLNAEITSLQGKVSASQWQAIDRLRKLGNIGAHMEKDVNLIIDIKPNEALQLKAVIELLLEKWYISRHEEEQLYKDIIELSDNKEQERKVIKSNEGVANND